MFGSKQLVLYLSESSIVAGVWRKQCLEAHQRFTNDAEGRLATFEWLQPQQQATLSILIDVADEDYRLETIPHTHRWQRATILARKFKRLYRDNPYRTAQFLRRHFTQRSNDHYLFIALNNPDFLKPWCEQISNSKLELTGIYLISMVSEIVLQHLLPSLPSLYQAQGKKMFFSLQRRQSIPPVLWCEVMPSTFRQSYFYEQLLYFSRLVPNVPSDPTALESFQIKEAERMRLYLLNKQMIAPDQALSLVTTRLPDDPNPAQADVGIASLSSATLPATTLAQTTFHPLTILPLLNQFKLPLTSVRVMPELLYMQFLASGKCPLNLAPHDLIRKHIQRRLKKILGWATGALCVLLAGILVAKLNEFQIYGVSIESAKREMLIAQHQLHKYRMALASIPLSISELQAVVRLSEWLKPEAQTPTRLMSILSSTLDSAPHIQINRLHYVLTTDLTVADEPQIHEAQDSGASIKNNPQPLREIAFIDGEITEFAGDYRMATRQVIQWVQTLQQTATIDKVELLQAPVNLASEQILQGSTQIKPQLPGQAKFKLKVILKLSAQVNKQ